MYGAKARGGRGVRLFDDRFGAIVEARLEMEDDLRHTVDRDQLALAYQPVVDLQDLSVVGVEALVRWNRPGYGELVASDFIDIAEESRLAVLIDRWVMQAVCKQAARWQKIRNGASPMTHINVSRANLARPSLVSEVASAIEESQVDPSRICVEAPEAALLSDLEESVARLDDLHSLGVNLSIDGFGSAATSLWHLRRMPIVSVKIDRAIVQNVSHNPLDSGIDRDGGATCGLDWVRRHRRGGRERGSAGVAHRARLQARAGLCTRSAASGFGHRRASAELIDRARHIRSSNIARHCSSFGIWNT